MLLTIIDGSDLQTKKIRRNVGKKPLKFSDWVLLETNCFQDTKKLRIILRIL